MSSKLLIFTNIKISGPTQWGANETEKLSLVGPPSLIRRRAAGPVGRPERGPVAEGRGHEFDGGVLVHQARVQDDEGAVAAGRPRPKIFYA